MVAPTLNLSKFSAGGSVVGDQGGPEDVVYGGGLFSGLPQNIQAYYYGNTNNGVGDWLLKNGLSGADYGSQKVTVNPDGTMAGYTDPSTWGKTHVDNGGGWLKQIGQGVADAAPLFLAAATGMGAAGLGPLAGMFGGTAGAGAGIGSGGAMAGTLNPALIESAAGTAGYGASSAGLGGMGLGGAAGAAAAYDPLSSIAAPGGMGGSGIPAFSQMPGYGNTVAQTADAWGGSPFTPQAPYDPLSSISAPGAEAAATVTPNMAATNPALIDSALGTAGYGLSSAGPGGGPGDFTPSSSGNWASDLLTKIFNPNPSSGVSTLGNLGSLFSNAQNRGNLTDMINQVKGIYSPDSVYAKKLQSDLARQDAAAGRNSQYGPRLERMMGTLADKQATTLTNLMSGYNNPMQTQAGDTNAMYGAAGRIFNNMGGMNSLQDLFNKYLTPGP